MEVLGRVIQKLDENDIKVEILRASACGGKCGECGNSCGSKSYIVATNYDGAKKDDVVKIETSDKKVLFLSFMVFIVPIFVIVMIYNLGNFIFQNENIKAVISFLGGLIAFIMTIIFFRRLKKPVSKVYYKNETGKYMD